MKYIAWQSGTIRFALTLATQSQILNVFKYKALCHSNCSDCNLLANSTDMNCLSCKSGLSWKSSNTACEIVCPAFKYPKSDYSECLDCPNSCTDCIFDTASVTYPFVPLTSKLICNGAEKYTITSNDSHTQFTLTFVSNPVSITTSNISFSTSSN